MTDMNSLLGGLAPWPEVDFSEFGEVEVRPQPRMQMIGAQFLGRNWVAIPHVTHHDEVDITDLEDRRAAWNAAHEGDKLTILPLLGKALADALVAFPQFNASLASGGKELVLKKYVNIGFAIDSPKGLLVGVVPDAIGKTCSEIGAELGALAAKAREKGLSYKEMSGGCMTISSLGHIGGTAFTPIVNAPEVAILGVTRTQLRPAPGERDMLVWRKMLPLSLSYDHRVINGADAARFVRFLGERLQAPDLFG